MNIMRFWLVSKWKRVNHCQAHNIAVEKACTENDVKKAYKKVRQATILALL